MLFSVILPSKFLIFLIGKLISMKKNFILFVTVFFMFSCEDDQTRESEDCAGVMGEIMYVVVQTIKQ